MISIATSFFVVRMSSTALRVGAFGVRFRPFSPKLSTISQCERSMLKRRSMNNA